MFIDSILSGFAVALGAVAYMTIYDGSFASNIAAGFCFSIIMMAIPFYKLSFFCGRPGILSDKNTDPIESIIIYIGNAIGITWITLAVKLVSVHDNAIQKVAHEVLIHLHEQSWDTIFVLSIFAGMMFYAGAMAINRGESPFYFLLINLVCVLAHWPTIHLVFFCLWSDTWVDFWYLIFPTTLGNVIGANLWVMLRKHSPTFQNAKYVKPDSSDIVDKFHDFVSNTKNHDNNDNFSHK